MRRHLLRISAEALKPCFLGRTCRPGGLAAAVDPVDLVGLRDVQLVPLRDLHEVGAFVERTPEPGLPHGGVGLVPPLPVLAFIHSPGLSGVKNLSVKQLQFSEYLIESVQSENDSIY